jgi:hypothetical protein
MAAIGVDRRHGRIDAQVRGHSRAASRARGESERMGRLVVVVVGLAGGAAAGVIVSAWKRSDGHRRTRAGTAPGGR